MSQLLDVMRNCTNTVENKYQSLVEGQKLWAKENIDYRLECLRKFSELLIIHKEELSKVLTQDMGKPIIQSRNEVEAAKKRVEYFLEHTKEWLEEKIVNIDGNTEERIAYEPLGVIGHISAWNYPYLVAFSTIIPALIAGNAVMYKPSEYTSETGLHIAHLLYEAGVPEDVFSTVIGDGTMGELLLKLPLKGYFFTGSVNTGRHISEKISSKLVPVGLELGGKDPLYVTDEINDIVQVASSCVEGCFYNNGQCCCAVERLYIHEKVYDTFVEAFLKGVNQLKVGDPFEETTDIGRLARPQHASFLNAQIEDALDKGAHLELGGIQASDERGYFMPTVLTNVNHTMHVMKEETFGPVIGIQKVSCDEEAFNLMNDTEYGLTASVYSSNTPRAKKILQRLDVGTGHINCCDRVSSNLPWSGRRNSGLGSTLSYLGILTFAQPKSYNIRV